MRRRGKDSGKKCPIDRMIDRDDIVKALGVLLQMSGAKLTFDRSRREPILVQVTC